MDDNKQDRDSIISTVLENDRAEFRAHYHAVAEEFFATLNVGGTFAPEEWHAKLQMPPRVPQSMSANSSSVLRGWLKREMIALVDVGTSQRRGNNATRMRVYRKLRKA